MFKKGHIPWNKGVPSPFKNKTLEEIVGIQRAEEIGKKIAESKKGDKNPMKNPIHKQTMINALKEKYATGYKNKNIGSKRTGQARKNVVDAQEKRRRETPQSWYDMSAKGGRNVHKKYPGKYSKTLQETHKKYSGLWSKVAKETNRKWKEQNPDDYYAKKRLYAKLMVETKKEKKKENPELSHMKSVQSGINSAESRRKNSPYLWDGVSFLSNEECKCAKLLLSKPIDGVNCNIKIGKKIIDFYPQQNDKLFQGKFVEFHPWDWNGLTENEYYKQRKKVIDNSEFKNKELIVITNLNSLKEKK